MASNAIKQLFNDADWGELDYLLVDLPPGTGDIHITISQSFPIAGAVIVTTPQQVALADTRKGLAMFNMQGINIPVLGVVENMAYFTPEELPANKYYIFGKDGGKELAQRFEVPFLGEIPLVQALPKLATKAPLFPYKGIIHKQLRLRKLQEKLRNKSLYTTASASKLPNFY
jgi:ATP-binding protein involved in chromosome partitioning